MGERHLGVDNILCQQVFTKIARNEGVVLRARAGKRHHLNASMNPGKSR